MKRINFGVIGHGFMGPRHVAMINSFAETTCVAVCDIDEMRLLTVPESIQKYTNADELLANDNIDVVVIATPNKTHKDLVIKATQAGKHIICEKPIAMSVADFEAMAAAAEKAGVFLTSHHQRRFDRDFSIVKAAYDQHLLGDVHLIKSCLWGFNGNMHDWHVYKSEGGGMLMDWGVHLLDQLLYLVDSPLLSVFADLRNVINFEVDDYLKIILRFANNVTTEIELSTYMLSDKEDWFPRHWFVFGRTGSLYTDGLEEVTGKIVRTTRLLTDAKDPTGRYSGPTRSFGKPEEGLLVTEELPRVNTSAREYYVNFIKALQGKEELFVTIPQLRRVLKVMDAIRTSSETKCSVSLG